MKALEQLMRQVNWGNLDVMVIDMPPGRYTEERVPLCRGSWLNIHTPL